MTDIDSRIRKGNGGALRIKDVISEDTGYYICKAINGFGSIEIGINLIVLDNEAGGNSYEFDAAKPHLTQVTKFPDPVIERLAGTNIKFKCEATGHPRPSISWFYNSHLLQARDEIARRGRWTLVINDLTTQDSGNYTCFIVNAHGNTSASFVLEVIDRVRNHPELMATFPATTTTTAATAVSPRVTVRVFPPALINPAEELFLPMPIIIATIGIFVLIMVSLAFLLLHCRNQKQSPNSPSIETSSARTVSSNSPKHHLTNGKGQAGQHPPAGHHLQQSHLLEHQLMSRRESPFAHHSPHHHYSPVHSNNQNQQQHQNQHQPNQQMGLNYSPAQSAFNSTPTPHPSELIPSHHHALLPASDKANRSSSVSPAFAQSVGNTRSSNVQYHQYYHIPPRTSYGYLC